MPLYITLLAYDVFINSRLRDPPPPFSDSETTTLLNHAPGQVDSAVYTNERQLSRIALSILLHWHTGDNTEIAGRISNFAREMYPFPSPFLSSPLRPPTTLVTLRNRG
jgi:hypothetical protein